MCLDHYSPVSQSSSQILLDVSYCHVTILLQSPPDELEKENRINRTIGSLEKEKKKRIDLSLLGSIPLLSQEASELRRNDGKQSLEVTNVGKRLSSKNH